MTRFRRVIDSPIGPLTLVADQHALIELRFGPPQVADAVTDPAHGVLAEASRQLDEYLAGQRREFELPLRPEGNEFELAVWWSLATIPYGETISYGQQAERIERPGAQQAVGAANGRNPIPIVLPCHRVIGADGKLVGFGGGRDVRRPIASDSTGRPDSGSMLDVKRWLLDLESGTQRLPFA